MNIDVKVDGLVSLACGSYCRLTGKTDTHPSNHYGTENTNKQVKLMALDYFEATDCTLGINDMSLKWGGLFDIKNNWSSPHDWHRVGRSVDIDRYIYYAPNKEYIKLNCEVDIWLQDIAPEYQGWLICEPGGKKHIEF